MQAVMKVMVNKCPWTGKLFEDDKAYQSHLRRLKAERKRAEEQALAIEQFEASCGPLYQLGTTDEVAAWLTANYSRVYERFGPKWSSQKKIKHTSNDRVLITFGDLHFNHVATTHHAPIGQKMTGWSKDCPAVREPAFQGRITATFEGRGYEMFDSDHLKKIGVNTGSGGGGPDHLSYEVVLYLKDFPRFKSLHMLNLLLERNGRKTRMDSNGTIHLVPPARKNIW